MSEYYYCKIIVSYADLLMLRGKFCDMIKILLDCINRVGSNIYSGVYIEIIRAIAHCYRHNRLFTQSTRYYDEIAHLANENYFHKSSYFTYLCETYCYSDPERAIRHYNEGISACRQLKAQSNLGKMYYAVGIAYVLLKNKKRARKYIMKSIVHCNRTGYKSGVYFALIALAYWEYSFFGKIDSITQDKIFRLQAEIGVYDYLLLPIHMMNNDQARILEVKAQHNWIDFDETKQSLQMFIGKLESIYLNV